MYFDQMKNAKETVLIFGIWKGTVAFRIHTGCSFMAELEFARRGLRRSSVEV